MEVMTVAEVAKHLKVEYETVLRMIKRGDLKAIKIGRVYRVRKDEVDRLTQGD